MSTHARRFAWLSAFTIAALLVAQAWAAEGDQPEPPKPDDLKGRIAQLEAQVKELQKSNTALTARVEELDRNKFGQVQRQIGQVNQQIQQLDARLKRIE